MLAACALVIAIAALCLALRLGWREAKRHDDLLRRLPTLISKEVADMKRRRQLP